MPQVEVTPTTYAALRRFAAQTGVQMDVALEQAVLQFITIRSMPDDQYQQAWDDLIERIQANLPPGITPEEVEADIDAALEEVRAEDRARSR